MAPPTKRRRVEGPAAFFRTEDDQQLLEVLRKDAVDEKSNIVQKEMIDYKPHVRSFNENDEIRITLNHKDAYTLPFDSVLIIEGAVTKVTDGTASPAKFVNNGFAHLFSEIRYEINGIVVDIIRKPGIATTLKGAASLSRIEREALAYAGWMPDDKADNYNDFITDASGKFTAWIPLRVWGGFFEDHRRVVYGVSQELVLIRGRKDADCLLERVAEGVAATESKITIDNVTWRMPHVQVDGKGQTYLSRAIVKSRLLPIDFMRWELHENPNVLNTKHHTWTVRATPPTRIPQAVMIAFQTGRTGNLKQNASQFDHCNVRSMKLFINDVQYPYRDLKATWQGNQHSELFNMFQEFDPVYNNRHPQSAVTLDTFWTKMPIFIFDCSKHRKHMLDSTLDLKLQWECTEDVPANTSVYALLLYPVTFHYCPISTVVREVSE